MQHQRCTVSTACEGVDGYICTHNVPVSLWDVTIDQFSLINFNYNINIINLTKISWDEKCLFQLLWINELRVCTNSTYNSSSG